MCRYADWAEEEARAFGRCLRRNAQKERNFGLFFLLSHVYCRTGRLFEAELARLLTDAPEAAEVKRTFTADQLSKMLKRHVLPSPQRPRTDNSTP